MWLLLFVVVLWSVSAILKKIALGNTSAILFFCVESIIYSITGIIIYFSCKPKIPDLTATLPILGSIVLSLIGYFIYLWILKQFPLSKISVYINLNIVITFLLSIFFLKETFLIKDIVAIFIILCGYLLFSIK